jgi:polyisoprenoid-binding protein YceI
MARWVFEPGHTAAEFAVRHMMVTYVRGHFKNIHGTLNFDPQHPEDGSVEVTIGADQIWTGEAARDAHLRRADFLDVERYPTLVFVSRKVACLGEHDFVVTGELTIRGVTREETLAVQYLGQWVTPWWEDGVDKGPKTRAGFVARTEINRQDYRVSWNAALDRGGVVVGDQVVITIDAEAILDNS